MVDYGPGDEIVVVRKLTNWPIGTLFVCDAVDDDVPNSVLGRPCMYCNTIAGINMLIAHVDINMAGCVCWFRKKLDFKKLCNVDETTKIKEDA